MKKLTFLVVAIVLSIGATMAQDFTVAGIGYKYGGVNGGVIAWGAPGYSGVLNIPATVSDGTTTYNVTELRHDFMDKCDPNTITSIKVPEGVVKFEVVSGPTFYNDGGNNGLSLANGTGYTITSISLPSTLTMTDFPLFTFYWFQVLTDLTIKMSTPPTVHDGTFYNCSAPTYTIHIPNGTTAAYQAAGWTTAVLGSGGHTVTLVEDISTALNNASVSAIQVSSSDRNVVVTGLTGMANVAIYDLSGKGVAKFSNVSNNQILNNSNLNAGIYVVKVMNGVNTCNSKLVLN